MILGYEKAPRRVAGRWNYYLGKLEVVDVVYFQDECVVILCMQ